MEALYEQAALRIVATRARGMQVSGRVATKRSDVAKPPDSSAIAGPPDARPVAERDSADSVSGDNHSRMIALDQKSADGKVSPTDEVIGAVGL